MFKILVNRLFCTWFCVKFAPMGRLGFILLMFFVTTVSNIGYSTNYTTQALGNWSAAATWVSNSKPGTWWGAGDTVFVEHAITLNQNIGFAGVMVVRASGSITTTTKNIQLNNNASFYGDGPVKVKNFTAAGTSNAEFTAKLETTNNLTVNGGCSFTISDTLDVGNNMTLNGGSNFSSIGGYPTTVGNVSEFNAAANVTFSGTFDSKSLDVNGANVTFDDDVTITNNVEFNNNNTVDIKADFTVGGNLKGNGGTTNISTNSEVVISGTYTLNGANTNNSGDVEVGQDFISNGGTFTNKLGSSLDVGDDLIVNGGGNVVNNGTTDVGDEMTLNSTFTNNSRLNTNGDITINGSGTLTGNGGLVRTNSGKIHTNYGDITGTLDFCNTDGTNTTFVGNGNISATITYCQLTAPLPVDLLDFTVVPVEQGVELSWTVANEVNIKSYAVEYSLDGMYFEVLDEKEAKGSSGEILSYAVIDRNAVTETVFYRLTIEHLDGRIDYSELKAITPKTEVVATEMVDVQILEGAVSIELLDETELSVSVSAYDFSGRLIETKSLSPIERKTAISVPEGIVILNITSATGWVESQKVYVR